MKRKTRRKFDIEEWKSSNTRHNIEILAVHIAAIVGIFAFAPYI
ncbi:hypothetical protein [Elizabethkingia anophelis]